MATLQLWGSYPSHTWNDMRITMLSLLLQVRTEVVWVPSSFCMTGFPGALCRFFPKRRFEEMFYVFCGATVLKP